MVKPDNRSMNVLFVICDDLNDWVLHPKDHPQVKTPRTDRLRDQSVSFTNAHAAVPVCGPSRKCALGVNQSPGTNPITPTEQSM